MWLGFAWSKKLTLSLTTRSDISGNDGAEVSLSASYKFWNPENALEKIEKKLKKRREEAEKQGAEK